MTAAIAPVWFTARAAGIGALFGASLTVALGLLMAGRARIPGLGRIEVRALHEAIALATLGLIAVHGVALLFDPVLKADLGGMLVPFAGPFEPFGTALGQVAAYGIIGLSLTYYARRLIGAKRWQKAHRAIPAFWVLGLVHGLIVGTDAWAWWFVAIIVPPAGAAWFLLVDRWMGRAGGRVERTRPQPARPERTGRDPWPPQTRAPRATHRPGAHAEDTPARTPGRRLSPGTSR